ncbi:MAG: hypothetical protein QFB86_02475 [Patescibacteria group bacterium]|nr:hypothetical protein [Patescibacteria group bacterium]
MDLTVLRATLQSAKTRAEVQTAIVNAPFHFKVEAAFLFLGIVVLLVVDEATGLIDRVALSNTELAENTTTVSAKPFHDIKIPLSNAENIIAQAISSKEKQETTDWKYLFTPALTDEEARLNQASGGIAYSAVYPLKDVKTGAAMIFSYYQYLHEIGDQQHAFMDEYSQLCSEALSRFAKR